MNARRGPARQQFRRRPARREQAREFPFGGGAHEQVLAGPESEAFEDESFDVQIHVHATRTSGGSRQRKSASLIGRSSLRNSVRAASSTTGIVTGRAARAARKAALSAMLWMLPPVRFSRASLS